MKVLVAYDSYYGNTERVAEVIAAELESLGQEAELRSMRKKYPTSPSGDVLFLGSPVRMGKTTKRAKKYLEQLDKDAWRKKPLVVFTTILGLPEDPTPERIESREKYDLMAGQKLADEAKAQGLSPLDERLAVDVTGLKGPLVKTADGQVGEFVRGVISRL